MSLKSVTKGDDEDTPLLTAQGGRGAQTPHMAQADIARPESYSTYSSLSQSETDAIGTGNGGSMGSIAYADPDQDARVVEVCPVGFREDPELFRKCLLSVKALAHAHMRVTIVVDGNADHSDWAMVQVAKEVFCEDGMTCFNLTHLPNGAVGEGEGEGKGESEGNGGEEWRLGPLVSRRALLDANVVCITQPHAGKRNAMYTAFCVAQARGAAYVLNTDSDTVLDASCLSHMVATMEARPHQTAAVAGVLLIFGPFNWLVKMTAARYRIAFQVERAAQGYWGSVLCVSGPLGLYNLKVVSRVKDEWVNQVG